MSKTARDNLHNDPAFVGCHANEYPEGLKYIISVDCAESQEVVNVFQ